MTSILHPVPFSSGALRNRRTVACWRAPEHASADASLPAAPRSLQQQLPPGGASGLWRELVHLLGALRGASSVRPETELSLQVAMVKAHDAARLAERDLADTAGEEGTAAAATEGQQWLQQLQEFLVALQHDLQQSRQALEASQPHAERDRQLLLKAAHSKLDLALLTSLPPAPEPTTPPEQQQQQAAESGGSSSQDSSCSSSVCGSSCTTGSSGSSLLGAGSGSSLLGAGSGSGSGSGSGALRRAAAANPRLVATRSKLGYTAHWALKVAL